MLTDTVKFARPPASRKGTILRRHVLKLISIPIVTVFGLEFGSTLAFAVVTETIFSWPEWASLSSTRSTPSIGP
jgi:peptide/nickel transport system permease protein